MQGDAADHRRFRDLTLGAFVERLSSAEPVPGGGSASAIAAALGASLVAMVAELSKGRPRYAAYEELHVDAAAAGRRLADRFLDLADEDATAYAAFAAALKLPRETDDDKAARTAAIGAAARYAAEVPLACVEACLELISYVERLAGRCNQNASSDLEVASHLAEAAAHGAAMNVLVNLPSVGDAGFGGDTTARVDELLHEIDRLADMTREAVGHGTLREPLEPSVEG